jgi:flagellar motility protein MotE (MotC chaperone)
MKTILIASTASFLLIFGGVFLYAQMIQRPDTQNRIGGSLSAADLDAAELAMAALEAERAQLDRQRHQLLDLREATAQERAQLQAQLETIQVAIVDLREEQVRYGQARSEAAQKLAKMFDAMKPDSAAPVFSQLDRATALDILVRMKEKSAARLLAEIDPRLAADLSTKLSLRGAR